MTATAAGCIRRARSIVSRDAPAQISLSITCVPAEEDPVPVRIVNYLREHLEAVGISVDVNYRSFEEYRFDVLLNHDFDLAVGRLPGGPDPDYLYGLFHSSLVPERGWQNPYGFASVELDEQLTAQRTEDGDERRDRIGRILEMIAREQPVAPLAFPVEHRVVRTDRYDGFENRSFADATDLLALDPGERTDSLAFTIGFTAPTKNLNPLSVEHRTEEIVTGLLYDSLLVSDRGEYYPWLAESIDWSDNTAVVTLRDAYWHDGEPVTSEDVVFTYDLLEDTTLGAGETPSPAPVYRSQSTMVTHIIDRDDQTLVFEFEGIESAARHALTVPILPEHEWRDRTETADIGGIENDPQTTEAIVTPNIPPIGSGPYRFEANSERDFVDLELVDDHFSTRVPTLSRFDPPAEVVSVVVAPSEAGAIEGVADGEFDFTLSPIPPEDITIESDGNSTVTETQSQDVYHIGYNTRQEPLSNASFRRVVSMLIDKEWIASEVFDGEAQPAVTPVGESRWVPTELEWDGTDPEVPFAGTDGTLDVGAAIDSLIDIGYQYDSDGNLRTT